MDFPAALYLIPVSISDAPAADYLPAGTISALGQIRHFIVENTRTARRFIKRCHPGADISGLSFSELNIHTDPASVSAMLEPLRQGMPIGIMSEAGCPGVADPGSLAVAAAQREGLRVVPLAGPSSILMSLMASGFNGQGFTFNGYLPIDNAERTRTLKRLEQAALKGVTQIFIETPYRNNRMVEMLAATLRPDTLLCVASGITDPEKESVVTLPAGCWRNRKYDYAKIPTIFLIYRNQP